MPVIKIDSNIRKITKQFAWANAIQKGFISIIHQIQQQMMIADNVMKHVSFVLDLPSITAQNAPLGCLNSQIISKIWLSLSALRAAVKEDPTLLWTVFVWTANRDIVKILTFQLRQHLTHPSQSTSEEPFNSTFFSSLQQFKSQTLGKSNEYYQSIS